jgi:putative transposase
MPRRKEPKIPDALLDQLLAGADPQTAFDPNGLLDGLKKALAERALNAEMDHHLTGSDGANRRNGYGKKTVLTDTGRIELEVPRDRQASFDPQLIAKYQRRFPGFDDKIVSMYARGMSTREIQGHPRELYGIDVSPDLISAVTDAVLEEVAAWQARPLEPVYPLVFFDALRVKIRDEGLVRNKAVHIALGVRADGTKEILGLWLEQNEGAKFWLRVMNELRNRGVEDVLIAVVDGLKGFPEAIAAVFPDATVQTCIVHLLRQSLAFVAYKDRKAMAAALKEVFTGPRTPARRRPPWPPSRRAPGAGDTPPSARAGAGPGTRSSRATPSRPRSGGCCTPRTPSRRSTPSSGGRSEPGATSRPTRPR